MAEDHKVHDGKKPEKVEDKTSSLDKSSENSKIAETTKVDKARSTKVENSKNAAKAVNLNKKTEAVINAKDLSIGRKHAVAICDFIRKKDIDVAIKDLEDVTNYKKAVPMKGEIPHRKGMSLASGSGRYPVKAAKIYIGLLKSLKANALVNDLELEKFKIFAMANRASRPYKRFGQGRFKRSHVTIKLIPRTNKNKDKK
jgi:ribosomal protein L22